MKALLAAAGSLLLIILTRIRIALPARWAGWMGTAVAWLAMRVVPSRRKVATRNLVRAFGRERSGAEIDRILQQCYRNLVLGYSDMLTLFRNPSTELLGRTAVRGQEHLEKALAAGKGVIGISAHYGAFPALGALMPALGRRFSFLYRRPKDARTAALFDDWLGRAGCGVIEDSPRHLAGIRCLKALGGGDIVCILIDQHFPAGVQVPFFGHPARTGLGAAMLALRSGAPLLPLKVRILPGDRYELAFEEPVEGPAGRDREDLVAVMARLTARVEAWIREDPAQWFWVHRRWKELDAAEDAGFGSDAGSPSGGAGGPATPGQTP